VQRDSRATTGGYTLTQYVALGAPVVSLPALLPGLDPSPSRLARAAAAVWHRRLHAQLHDAHLALLADHVHQRLAQHLGHRLAAEWAWERAALGDGQLLSAPRDDPYGSSTACPCSSLSIYLSIYPSIWGATVRATYRAPEAGTRTQYVQYRGALRASRPAPSVRTQRGRPVRVARAYPTEAPGRACQPSAARGHSRT